MFSFDAGHILLEELHPGETVVVRWLVPVFTQSLTLSGAARFKWSWEGSTVTGVEPRGTGLPLF
jgi:hypothetical protein